MKQQNFLDEIVTSYQQLDGQEQRKYMIAGIVGSIVFTILLMYITISQKNHYIAQIKSAYEIAQKTVLLTSQNNRINDDDAIFVAFADENPLKGGLINYVTSFASTQQITLAPDWQKSLETIAIPHSEDFEEQRVTISINGQTTEKTVTLMEALRQERMVLLRNIELVRNNESLNLTLILAARNRTTSTGL